jgi:siroheme synthase (precorrin-2 oxidase/ferrochelatase)
MSRTALLIRCAAIDAERIRTEAERARLTISAYVLGISIKAVEFEDRQYSKSTQSDLVPISRKVTDSGPRTAILVRCDNREAERIREAARRRNIPINSFVLQSLKRAWNSANVDDESTVS